MSTPGPPTESLADERVTHLRSDYYGDRSSNYAACGRVPAPAESFGNPDDVDCHDCLAAPKAESVLPEYHRHIGGDVVPGPAIRCIDPDAGAHDVIVLTTAEFAAAQAEAWERGHFYCAAEVDTDKRCINPYGAPRNRAAGQEDDRG